MIILHHLIVRSGGILKFPYELYGWPIDEYLGWLGEHNRSEALGLIKLALDATDRRGQPIAELSILMKVMETALK